MSMGPNDQLLVNVETLQNLLVARATSGSGDFEGYAALREQLMSDRQVWEELPSFVKTCRDLNQFWNWVKGQAPSYGERRRIIYDSFQPVLSKLEAMKAGMTGQKSNPAPHSGAIKNPNDGTIAAYYDGPPILRETERIAAPIATTPLATLARPAGKADHSAESPTIFIGHGRSRLWLVLKEFLVERLHLQYEEFNREPMAGISTVDRLQQLLERADFAFLLLTPEDEQLDGTVRARENVVHEAGLFQGKLGFRKAIVLLEEGCDQFSNIRGLTHIPFPKGKPEASFEEIRRVLERERLIR